MTQIAPAIYALGILGLFILNRERGGRTSITLWLPVVWVSIAGSRMVSQWLEMTPSTSVDQLSDGSPLDRNILMGFLAVGLIILLARGQKIGALLRANGPILVYFLYCGLSIFWSDYPGVAFKRWTKSVGDLVMILIVLTDPDTSAAVKRFLSRTAFILLPLSVLFIKYYPAFGRTYDRWVGTASYTGVTTDKNMLGMLCLVLGLASWWRLLQCFRDGKRAHRMRQLIAHVVVFATALWLLSIAHSMTSLACFVLAGCLMAATSLPLVVRRPALVHVLVFTVLLIAFSALFLNLGTGLVMAMGRDPTLTGRTDVWNTVLGMAPNHLLGAGFESFWLGPRLQKLWSIYWWRPSEAHNGYIETFLNLGWTGVVLLAVVMVAGYRRIVYAVYRHEEAGTLALGYFVASVAYNFTEAAFKTMNLVWICLLLANIVVSKAHVTREATLVQAAPELGPQVASMTNSA